MIHSTAIISNNAIIGENVLIGAYTIIHDNVVISDNSEIGSYCEIGLPTKLSKNKSLKIGKRSFIRSHSVLYSGSEIGTDFVTGHWVTVRENSSIGQGVQLGNRSDVQGDCEIGSFTRMHADVHIGKKSQIGAFCWIFPGVLLTNDPMPPSEELMGVKVGDYVVICAQSLIMPGVNISNHSVVSAGSLVNLDVPEGKLVKGNPAKIICNANVIRMPHNLKIKAYPWHLRFFRGYPKNQILKWKKEL